MHTPTPAKPFAHCATSGTTYHYSPSYLCVIMAPDSPQNDKTTHNTPNIQKPIEIPIVISTTGFGIFSQCAEMTHKVKRMLPDIPIAIIPG